MATDSLHLGRAWVGLCLAFALHIADEALTDFLSVYNPAVRAIRERYPSLPLPTFTFEVWLAGLILAVVVLFALSPFAFQGAGWMVPLSYIYGTIILLNGVGHAAGSIFLGRALPGVYSSPLLLAASIYLLVSVHRRQATRAASSRI